MKSLIYALLILLFIIPISFALYHGPEYTYRVFVWQGADYDDYLRFNTTPINNGDKTFQFYQGSKVQMDQFKFEFETHPMVENVDSFMVKNGTYAFIAIRNDTILYERYFNNNEKSSLQTSFSTAKSVLSLLVGIAISENKIESVNDPVTKYIPELKFRDKRFEQLSIEHLLTMRSGLKFKRGVTFPFVNCDEPLSYSHPDLRKVAIRKTEVDSEPGKTFIYNDYNALLLGLVLERALGEGVSSYLERKLWEPLGMEYEASWNSDENGFEQMQSGINARAVDFAKIGRLVLKNGTWDNKMIVDSTWISHSVEPTDTLTFRSGQQWGYGYLWWMAIKEGMPNDIFACGNMGQFIYINPATNSLIIRNGLESGQIDDDDWIDIFSNYTGRLTQD